MSRDTIPCPRGTDLARHLELDLWHGYNEDHRLVCVVGEALRGPRPRPYLAFLWQPGAPPPRAWPGP